MSEQRFTGLGPDDLCIMRTEGRKCAQHSRGTCCICRYKSNSNTIVATTVPRTITVCVVNNTLDIIYISCNTCLPKINARSYLLKSSICSTLKKAPPILFHLPTEFRDIEKYPFPVVGRIPPKFVFVGRSNVQLALWLTIFIYI